MVCGNTLFKSMVDVEYQKNLSVCGIEKVLRGSEQASFQERLETPTWSSHWEIKLLIEGCVCVRVVAVVDGVTDSASSLQP